MLRLFLTTPSHPSPTVLLLNPLRIKASTTFATLSGRYLKGDSYEVAALDGKQWIRNGWATEVKPPRAKKPKTRAIRSQSSKEV
jgi:hypothetical protein